MIKITISVSKQVESPLDALWLTIRQADGVQRWFPLITACRLEGTGAGARRFCQMTNGAELEERILRIDDAVKEFEYTIEKSPLPVDGLKGLIRMHEQTIQWSATFACSKEHAEVVTGMLANAYATGIEGLDRSHLEEPHRES